MWTFVGLPHTSGGRKSRLASVPDTAQKKSTKIKRQMCGDIGEMIKIRQLKFWRLARRCLSSIVTPLALTTVFCIIPISHAASAKTYYYVQGDIASEMPSKAICEAKLREHFAFDKKIRGAKVYTEDPWPPRCLKYLPPRFFGARKLKSR
jgi:hypothetical protein